MRDAASIFDAHEKQRLAVLQPRRPRIENAIGAIRPLRGRQDRVVFMATKQLLEMVILHPLSLQKP